MHEPYVRNEQGFTARFACKTPFATICKNADAGAESAYHYTRSTRSRKSTARDKMN